MYSRFLLLEFIFVVFVFVIRLFDIIQPGSTLFHVAQDSSQLNCCHVSVCQVSMCHARKALLKKVGAIAQIKSQYMYFTILQTDM